MTLEEELIKKHKYGQKKYGEFTFLEKDMRKEASEELIDAINYLTYDKIKEDFTEKEIRSWSKEELNAVFMKYVSRINKMEGYSVRLKLFDICKLLCSYHS